MKCPFGEAYFQGLYMSVLVSGSVWMTNVREELEVFSLTNLCSQLVKNWPHQQKAIVTISEINHACKVVECNPRNGDLNTTQLYPTCLFFCLGLLDCHCSPQSIERPLFFFFFGSLRVFVSPFTSPELIDEVAAWHHIRSRTTISVDFQHPSLASLPPKKKQSTYSHLVDSNLPSARKKNQRLLHLGVSENRGTPNHPF